MVKLCTRFEQERPIRGGVIGISVFDLMMLNTCHVLRYLDNFTKFKLSQSVRS